VFAFDSLFSNFSNKSFLKTQNLMQIQFLGTASGTPTKSRNVSALALRSLASRRWSLVDCGEGTQHRILHTSLSLASLEAIFITHIHGDHCYGMPGLLASAGMLNRTEPLWIVGSPAVRAFVESALSTTGLQLPYALEFVNIEAGDMATISVLKEFEVRATPLSHRVPCHAYSFTEKNLPNKLDIDRLKQDGIPPGPLWGRIQEGRDVRLPDGRSLSASHYLRTPGKPRRIIIAGDNDTPGLLTDEARTAEVVVHESTYTEQALNKIGAGPQHSSALRVARWAETAEVANLVLTHFSPRYLEQKAGVSALAEVEAEARSQYSGRLFLANDLERYVLDKHGELHLHT
jgi:ribonuclease Z